MLVLISILLAIAFCFFASSICIAVVLAAFMAILADPAVQFLERLRIPRYLAAALVGDGFAKWPRRLQRPDSAGEPIHETTAKGRTEVRFPRAERAGKAVYRVQSARGKPIGRRCAAAQEQESSHWICHRKYFYRGHPLSREHHHFLESGTNTGGDAGSRQRLFEPNSVRWADLGGGRSRPAGLVQFHSTARFLMVIGVVSVLHLVAANLRLPRFVSSRLDVGPVAATVGLLFWGRLWGIPGILLAVPLTAILKLLADSDPALAHFVERAGAQSTSLSSQESRATGNCRTTSYEKSRLRWSAVCDTASPRG